MSAGDVSTVIPVFNGAAWVGDALDSVLSQTWPPGECIVVDDGSTDGTPEVLAAYADRVVVLRVPNGGVARARNIGAQRSSGRWVAFLDADDVWLPERLERQLRALDGASDVAIAYCGLTLVDERLVPHGRTGVPSATSALRNTLLLEPPSVSIAQAALVDRASFLSVGGFDEEMSTSADADLVVRLAARFPVQALDEALVLYRQHDGQMSSNLIALEHDVVRLYSKAFGTGLLPPGLDGQSGRGRANLHASLAAESVSRGSWATAARHGVRAIHADRARVIALVARRVRRLASRGHGA